VIHQHVKKTKSDHFKQLVVYGLVGGSALVVQDIIYYVAHKYGVFPSVAMGMGTIGGMFVAYFGHIKYTFKKGAYTRREFIKFVITSLIGLVLNVGSVRIIIKVLELNPTWGLVPTLITPFITFLISKFWAFK